MTVSTSKPKDPAKPNHTFGDLEEELRHADRSYKRKRIALIIALFLIVSGSVIAMSAHKNNHPANIDDSSRAVQEGKLSTGAEPAAVSGNSVQEGAPSESVAQPVQQRISPNVSQAAPAAQLFDQTSFITTGKSVVLHYNQIVGLVTFGSSTSQEQRVAGIKQAYALNRQYFNEVTNLRMLINQADSVPGKYTNLVSLAENGVSGVSVGVDEMYRWATGSATGSIDSGSAMVSQGAASLLQFSQQL